MERFGIKVPDATFSPPTFRCVLSAWAFLVAAVSQLNPLRGTCCSREFQSISLIIRHQRFGLVAYLAFRAC